MFNESQRASVIAVAMPSIMCMPEKHVQPEVSHSPWHENTCMLLYRMGANPTVLENIVRVRTSWKEGGGKKTSWDACGGVRSVRRQATVAGPPPLPPHTPWLASKHSYR